MKKLVIILALAIAMPQLTKAQNDEDALRYSLLNFGGTARALGSANAYGALGGDFSAVSTNPAGLGVYRSSEFVITPGLLSISSQSSFLGETNNATKYDFNLANVGLVFSKLNAGKENASDSWVGGSFAIGYNKLANYNSTAYYSGFNASSSLLDSYASFLNGTNPSNAYESDPFGAGLAWDTYLLNPNQDDSSTYYGVINGGNVQQSKSIVTEGSYNEFTIAVAGNYGNKLYIGATLGIPNIDYSERIVYSEDDKNNVHPDFENFELRDDLQISGIGINGKFGIIYKLNNYVRVGGALHTPTFISLSDTYFASIESSLDVSGSYSSESPIGQYDYQINTPWRMIGSAAFTLKNYGFISIDYEFVDYSEASVNFNKIGSVNEVNQENAINEAINTKYGASSIIRLGGEFMYNLFRFRGGYSLQGTPFNTGIAVDNADFSKNTWTVGIGIKEKSYFIDFAYANSKISGYDIQYLQNNTAIANEGANIKTTLNNFLISVGFRF